MLMHQHGSLAAIARDKQAEKSSFSLIQIILSLSGVKEEEFLE